MNKRAMMVDVQAELTRPSPKTHYGDLWSAFPILILRPALPAATLLDTKEQLNY